LPRRQYLSVNEDCWQIKQFATSDSSILQQRKIDRATGVARSILLTGWCVVA
jgi:hypothetical protein